MQIQSKFNTLHTCTSRNTGYIPTNPHYAAAPGSVIRPGSPHTFQGHHPYYPHTFPNQGIQTIPNSHLYLNAYMSNAACYHPVAPRYITPPPPLPSHFKQMASVIQCNVAIPFIRPSNKHRTPGVRSVNRGMVYKIRQEVTEG